MDGKNLHMVCVEDFAFVTRGHVGVFLNRAVYTRWEAGGCTWTSDGEDGRWLGLHVKIGGRSCNLVVSHLPTQRTPMATQARSVCFCDGTDIVDKLFVHTLGGLIIGGDFNSHLGRDAAQGGTSGAHGLTTPTSAKDGSWKTGFGKTRGCRRCLPFHKQILEDVWALAATSKDNMGTLALQTATCEEWLPSLREYLAIRATSPSLACVQNQRISEFYKREADRCQECDLWISVQTSAFQPIATMFWMLAILADAPPVAMHKGKDKDKFDQSTLLLKVVLTFPFLALHLCPS